MGTIYLDGVCYSSGGGGGGGASSADQVSLDDTNLAYVADDVQEAFEKVTKSLTYAEYEALTEEEKNNGTIYLITDVNGDGQSFQPVIYSEEEREIGVWIDGKPLYEKTIDFGALPNNTTKSINHNISNLDKVAFLNGIAYKSGDIIPIPFSHSSNVSNQPQLSIGNTTINIKTANDQSDRTGYITVRYTKTTDVAGSGQWTPQGVPAVRYSTEEQVVGTWIDGSTIYEKVLTPSGTFGDGFNYIPHGVSNFNQLLDYFGYCTYGSSDKMNIPNLRGSSYVTISSWDATNIRLEKANLSSALSNVNLVIRYTKSTT